MNFKKISLFLSSLTSIGLPLMATADGFDWQWQGGLTTGTHFTGNPQDIAMNSTTTNRYSVTSPSQTDLLLGAGVGYHIDRPGFTTHLGLNVYHLSSRVSGLNSPAINDGTYDTLTYSADGDSNALMFEPKLLWTTYSLQPYVLTGIGLAVNHFSHYQENNTVAGSSAYPTTTPFNSQTHTGLAYEVGLGLQYTLDYQTHAPSLAVDYRFMDWGKAGLAPYTNQASQTGLTFGHLQTTSINVSMIWPLD